MTRELRRIADCAAHGIEVKRRASRGSPTPTRLDFRPFLGDAYTVGNDDSLLLYVPPEVAPRAVVGLFAFGGVGLLPTQWQGRR